MWSTSVARTRRPCRAHSRHHRSRSSCVGRRLSVQIGRLYQPRHRRLSVLRRALSLGLCLSQYPRRTSSRQPGCRHGLSGLLVILEHVVQGSCAAGDYLVYPDDPLGQLVALLKARFKLTFPQQIKPPLTQPVEVALVLRYHLAHRLHDTHRLSGKIKKQELTCNTFAWCYEVSSCLLRRWLAPSKSTMDSCLHFSHHNGNRCSTVESGVTQTFVGFPHRGHLIFILF
nr:MAG TPA: hypothetical protein [Caudoviricetes sp.]